jgi:hypothetical protein
VLLVLKGEDESIRLLVHPEIRTIVQQQDLAYIEALLLDFPERAKQHPEEFFKQILSLGVGPLVVQEEESNLSFMQKLVSQFIQISTTTG